MMVIINRDKIGELMSRCGGVCIECGKIREDGVEPDSVNYWCESCGTKNVIGIDNAILNGFVVPVDTNTPRLNNMEEKTNEHESER